MASGPPLIHAQTCSTGLSSGAAGGASSMFTCFAYHDGALVGAGRVLADGVDCAYTGDVAVHPEHQGRGLGGAIIRRLVELAGDHKQIILYASPGTEGFYRRLGFLP